MVNKRWIWDTFLGQGKVQIAEISRYDLDEKLIDHYLADNTIMFSIS